MQLKILSKRWLLLVIPSGCLLFTALFLNFIPDKSAQGSPALLINSVVPIDSVLPINSVVPIDSALPVDSAVPIKNNDVLPNQGQASVGVPSRLSRLKIPVINVDSAVIPVGLTPDGSMAVPKNPADVAWYRLGARPGEKGTAVMAGHYDWINNQHAVFEKLHTLRKGDTVSVTDENGIITNFIVREIRIYGKDDDASNVFLSSDDKAHLNLITCTGIWNKAEYSYSERLVVFTDKVE